MTSLNFSFIESIASNADSTGVSEKEIDSIKKFDVIVIQERPAQIMEISHSSLWMHKYHLLAMDIFSGRRCETVISSGQMVQVPNLSKKDYLILSIDDDNYVTLLDEDICNTRNDLKLRKNSDLGRRILDKYNEGNHEITVTVIKALGEEQIMEFKIVD